MDGFGEVLQSYGLAGLCISVLSGVALTLYRDNKALQKEKNDIQEARLNDLKEINTKIVAPLEEQTRLSKIIYDVVIDSKRGA